MPIGVDAMMDTGARSHASGAANRIRHGGWRWGNPLTPASRPTEPHDPQNWNSAPIQYDLERVRETAPGLWRSPGLST